MPKTLYKKCLTLGLIFALTVLFMTGCTLKLGLPFDEGKIEYLKAGTMKQSEVKNLLGLPASIGDKNGKALWTYIYVVIPVIGSTARGSFLSIEFDKNGIISDYTFIPY